MLHLSHLRPLREAEVLFGVELLLQLEQLLARERRPPPTRFPVPAASSASADTPASLQIGIAVFSVVLAATVAEIVSLLAVRVCLHFVCGRRTQYFKRNFSSSNQTISW